MNLVDLALWIMHCPVGHVLQQRTTKLLNLIVEVQQTAPLPVCISYEIGCQDLEWAEMAKDSIQWQAFEMMVMNLWVS